ncbi:MAG: hypothetical protein ACKN9E_00295 [Microcystaceae cyanobacterium]
MLVINQSESVANLQALNEDILQSFVDIFPHLNVEQQQEVSKLMKQVYRINYLQRKQVKLSRFLGIKVRQDSVPFDLLLQELKYILIVIKNHAPDPEIIQELRLGLERDINQYHYPISGRIINFFNNFYHIKSVPFKIFIGLTVTTFLSILMVNICIQQLYYSRLQTTAPIVSPLPSPAPKTESSASASPLTPSPKGTIFSRNEHIWYELVYAAMAGVLGSVASILLRIIDFRNQNYDDPLIPFFIGLLKPLIGLIFGMFVFSLIGSETLIKFDFINAQSSSANDINSKARQDLFVFSCSFIVGFSERFASDLLKKSESSIIDSK